MSLLSKFLVLSLVRTRQELAELAHANQVDQDKTINYPITRTWSDSWGDGLRWRKLNDYQSTNISILGLFLCFYITRVLFYGVLNSFAFCTGSCPHLCVLELCSQIVKYAMLIFLFVLPAKAVWLHLCITDIYTTSKRAFQHRAVEYKKHLCTDKRGSI